MREVAKRIVRCCMFAAIVLFAFQVNAQNKKVNFVAEMSFGRVSYLSPSCLSVVNPEECDVTSFGMNLKMGVDLKGLTLKADLSSFGGAYFYDALRQKREETGTFYAGLEIGFNFNKSEFAISPFIGVGMLRYESNYAGYKFSGNGLGSSAGLSLAYNISENFAVKASLGAVFGNINSISSNSKSIMAQETIESFDSYGGYPLCIGRSMIGVEVRL